MVQASNGRVCSLFTERLFIKSLCDSTALTALTASILTHLLQSRLTATTWSSSQNAANQRKVNKSNSFNFKPCHPQMLLLRFILRYPKLSVCFLTGMQRVMQMRRGDAAAAAFPRLLLLVRVCYNFLKQEEWLHPASNSRTCSLIHIFSWTYFFAFRVANQP